MRGILKKNILLGILTWVVSITSAQVKFTASITPSHINKNEYAVLRLEVRNGSNVEQITPPSLKDFDIVSGPNQESGMSTVNGDVTQYVALSYILLPRRPGLINLPSSIAKISGK